MLKGAIIGTGKIAVTGHLPAYLSDLMKEKVKLVACADSFESSRVNFSKQFRDIPVYSSLDELFSNHKLDFVDICVPPVYHKQYIEQAVSGNLNIICEKPFTLNNFDARVLKELLLKSGKAFVPCHQYRFSPIWSNFKNLIDNYESKWILQFNVNRLQADNGFNPENPSWRTDSSISGGGILADTGIHYIYLSTWLLGSPKSVTAKKYSLKQNRYNVEDTVFIVIECEKGIVQINLTWAADKRANSASLVSEKASMYYNGESLLKNADGKSESIPVPDASDKTTYITQYVCLIDEFISRIKNKQGCEDWINEAYNSIRLLNASYLSAESSSTIELNNV